jgi:hypothetical protein
MCLDANEQDVSDALPIKLVEQLSASAATEHQFFELGAPAMPLNAFDQAGVGVSQAARILFGYQQRQLQCCGSVDHSPDVPANHFVTRDMRQQPLLNVYHDHCRVMSVHQ